MCDVNPRFAFALLVDFFVIKHLVIQGCFYVLPIRSTRTFWFRKTEK